MLLVTLLFLLLSLFNCNGETSSIKGPYKLSPIVRRIINTKNAPAAIGAYSQAVQVGNTLYVSGNIGLDPATGTLVPGGISAQAYQALTNMGFILQEAGCGYDNVVKTDILLANITDFEAVNDIYQMFFKTNYPTRVTYAVAGLPKGALVEIDAFAVVGDLIDV